MDPLAEKYYSISPYAFCANNPVRYTDPDGREIVIGSFVGRLMAKFGINNFEAKVQQQLESLKNMDNELNSMISGIEQSSITYRIKSIEEYPYNKGNIGNCYLPENNTIYFDPDNTILHGETRPAEAGLAHELGHAENDMKGERISYNRYEALHNDNTIEQNKWILNEINSIDMENIVREHMGYKERDYNYFYEAH